MPDALRRHWPEYLMEAAALGLFMVSACLVTALLQHPASPLRQALPSGTLRRGLGGLAMGLTAVALIYSPWGKQSGAHMNPAITLTFLRLGKVRAWDAAFYVSAQFVGGLLGVVVSALLLRDAIAHPTVGYAVTAPGPEGPAVAFTCELLISFLMMLMVLATSSRPGLGRYTGLFAGTLVALYIFVESPLSGMSMNPARTVASALPAGSWSAVWIYFAGPLAGMLLAAETFLALTRGRAAHCAKLHHANCQRCIFCGAAAA